MRARAGRSAVLPSIGKVEPMRPDRWTPTDAAEPIRRRTMGQVERPSLVRPREGRILGGVCAGLGRRFGVSPWAARVLFVLILMIIPGSQLLVYPVLWIAIPSE